MADTAKQPDDKALEKAVWHYVGVGVLWIALVLSGIALERLGLTSGLLAGVLPGEVGGLRAQVAECENNLRSVNQERDLIMRSKQALEVEVGKLKRAAANTAPSQ
ncbi:MAG: hypothetical protein AB1671_11010 [Thermodesulfobacteriota bacterium]